MSARRWAICHRIEQGGYGILAAGGSSQVIALPVLAPDANGTERKGRVHAGADGTLTGSLDAFHIGPRGRRSSLLPEVHRRERAARVLGKEDCARSAGRVADFVRVCAASGARQAAGVPLQDDGQPVCAHGGPAAAGAAARGGIVSPCRSTTSRGRCRSNWMRRAAGTTASTSLCRTDTWWTRRPIR